MKKFNPTTLMIGFFTVATIASLMGAISGSLAWYAYAARGTLSYSGTSVTNTMHLQIGLVSEKRIAYTSSDGMIEETYEGDPLFYYFAPAGKGLDSNIIGKYLEHNDYAVNSLYPLTSGSYCSGDPFSLKQAPNLENYFNAQLAEKQFYAHIPFIFRSQSDMIGEGYVEGLEIWLTDATTRASTSNDGEAYKSLRLHIERESSYEDGGFILNPSASSAGETKVGGLLDLDKNQYYDVDAMSNEEIIYGEYESKSGLSSLPYEGEDELDDVNGVGNETNATSFLAKHRQGSLYYTSDSLQDCGIKTAQYLSMEDIRPINDSHNVLANADPIHPTSICVTSGEEGHYIGRMNMTVYLEGWDFALTDLEINHLFDIGLTFEINALGNS